MAPTPMPTARAQRRAGDKGMRVLIYAIAVALVLVFAGAAYIATQVLGVSKAPRTAVERNILMLQSVVQEKPTSSKAWGDYVKSLIEARQFARAESALDEARAVVGTTTAVQVEQVRLLQARGRTRQALDLAEDVVVVARAEKKTKLDSAMAAGITGGFNFPDLVNILVMRGDLLVGEKRYDEAVKSYTEALEEDSTMADVRVSRAEAYLAAGDAEAARKDFETALEMLPDYEPALEGLEKTKTEGAK